MASVDEIFSQINELKPMEIASLIKRMETEWGVTAAPAAIRSHMPVMPSTPSFRRLRGAMRNPPGTPI